MLCLDLSDQLPLDKIKLVSLELPFDEETHYSYLEMYKDYLSKEGKNWSEKRLKEFTAGRICAHKAAEALGKELHYLKRKSSGAPEWPDFLVGSITHSKTMAVAAVGESRHYRSIGVDAEKIIIDQKKKVLERMVLTPEEKVYLEQHDFDKTLATIIFSAKESLYKLLNPLVDIYINFDEGIVSKIDEDKQCFTIELKSEKKRLKQFCGEYVGHYYLGFDNVISVILM